MTAAPRAGFGPTLALLVTVTLAAFALLMSVVLLAVHPQIAGLGGFVGLVNQQNQTAKTLLYALAFLGLLPASIVLVPRVADRIAGGPNAPAISALAAVLAALLAAAVLVVRVSAQLPWGDGLKALLVAMLGWSVLAAGALWRAARARPWPAATGLGRHAAALWVLAEVLTLAVLVGLTSPGSLHVVPLAGALAVGLVLLIASRRGAARPGRRSGWPGRLFDVVAVVLLALAAANVVVFHASPRLPSIYIPPGVIQNQQDYLLGSANQLLGGGALLVNVPVSQYGVGLVYFLAAWFHIVPIGYGTLGLLDSILTAAFYVAAYALLRMAGLSRLRSAGTMVVALLCLLYALHYPVGSLPEAGPLRFGWPMVIVILRVLGLRRPSLATLSSAGVLGALGLAAVWGFEAFAYSAFVYVVMAGAQAWLRAAGTRRRSFGRALLAGAIACVVAHLVLALVTLLATGRWPDWGQYLAYLHSFLLGGEAGAISYGFARWSPALAVAAATFALCAAIVLRARRQPEAVRAEPVRLLALAGLAAYAVAFLSYVDNRSATYLLPYVTLPLLLAGALVLEAVTVDPRAAASTAGRHLTGAAAAGALVTVALMLSAAWPSIGTDFGQTALARARPGGGLVHAVHRLAHPPPIDPRAPEAVRLLRRYAPGRRALIVLPLVPDLAVETLMRSRRSSPLFIADPVDDSLVLGSFEGRLRAEIRRLASGQLLLVDSDTLRIMRELRARPAVNPAAHPIDGGDQEDEWLIRELDRRFVIRPVHRGRFGLIVAELRRR